MKKAAVLVFALCLMAGAWACAPVPSNAASASEPRTSIVSKGSDTMVNLALAWAEAYQPAHPEVTLSVTGGGSGTGISALISGTTDIANASRAIKAEELEAAHANGIEPLETVVARDAIAIIVHKDNPVSQLTLQQISDIYTGKLNNWAELGGEDRPIVRLSRETNSGTHVYFLETVLRMGDPASTLLFDPRTLLLPSSEGITSEVRDNPNAIGYDGLGYVTEDVKIIAVAATQADPYVLPSAASVSAGSYPISRDLYIYTNGQPQGALQAFVAWLLSAPAQQIVLDLGFVPVEE
jgi:phosphate transport system substrate-binding protein